MAASDLRSETDADTASRSPLQRARLPWTTWLWITFDVAVQRKSPWVSAGGWMVVSTFVIMVASVTALLSGMPLAVITAAPMVIASLIILLSGPIIDRLKYRMHERAARPNEVAALRLKSRHGTWPLVREAAKDWRRSCPTFPITIAMVLRWEGEAAAKVRAAKPPTIAEQAAMRAQALAFEQG